MQVLRIMVANKQNKLCGVLVLKPDDIKQVIEYGFIIKGMTIRIVTQEDNPVVLVKVCFFPNGPSVKITNGEEFHTDDVQSEKVQKSPDRKTCQG